MSRKAFDNINQNLLFAFYFLLRLCSLGASCFCIFLGYRLFIHGITGVASLSVETETVRGKLLNAAPGLFFAIGGVIALISAICSGPRMMIERDKNGRWSIKIKKKPSRDGAFSKIVNKIIGKSPR